MAAFIAVTALPSIKLPARADGTSVNIWWPTAGVTMTGVQPFKAALTNYTVDQYRMTWRVDGGAETTMYNSPADYPHKEAMVNVSGWNWKGNGPYTITYTAYDNSGNELATSNVSFEVGSTQNPTTTLVTPSAKPTPTVAATSQSVKTPVISLVASSTSPIGKLYVDPNSEAAQQVAAWQSTQPSNASELEKIADSSVATWFGGWNTNVTADVAALSNRAASAGATPILVAYNIPERDCGGYSSGGASTGDYSSWISAFAAGLNGHKAVIILEPDALADMSCLSASDQAERTSLLSGAVSTIKQTDTQALVYLDAGHSGWVAPSDMAARLNSAGLAKADGFSLNVSNFIDTQTSEAYGTAISQAAGGSKHFVIDTSRNGLGADGSDWCNPDGRALGVQPTTATNDPLADAFLWIKAPGESDGSCNGGPSAGTWWPAYALGLAERASY